MHRYDSTGKDELEAHWIFHGGEGLDLFGSMTQPLFTRRPAVQGPTRAVGKHVSM